MKHIDRRLLIVLILFLLLLQTLSVHAGIEIWTTDSLWGYDVRSIAIDPQAPALLYAFAPTVTMRSIDGGTEWMLSSELMLGGLEPGQFEIDPLTSNIFYKALSGQLWRSFDRGATWAELAPGLLSDVRWFLLDRGNPNVLWAFTAQDTLRSLDGGENWASAGLPMSGFATAFAQAGADGSTIYAAIERQGLFRSDDRGKTWLVVGAELPQGMHIRDIVLGDAGAETVYLSGDQGPFRSTDRGRTWQPIAPEQGEWQAARLVVTGVGGRRVLLVSRDTFVALSPDGGTTWRVTEKPVFSSEVRQVVVDPQVPDVVYVLTNMLWKSQDGGANWSDTDVSPPGLWLLAAHPQRANRLYANGSTGVLRSEDSGRSWQTDPAFSEGQMMRAIAWAPSDANVAYASYGQGLLRSTDGGAQEWQLTPLPETTSVQTIHVSPHDSDLVFVVSDGRVLFSSSGGEAWGVLPLPAGVVATDLALAHEDAGVIYVAAGNTIYRSEDKGQSWLMQTDQLPPVSHLLVDPVNSQHLLALAGGSIRASQDGGQNWASVQGLEDNFNLQGILRHPGIPAIVYTYGPQQIYISPNGGQTWLPMGGFLPDSIRSVIAGNADDLRYVLATTGNNASWRYSYRGLPPTPTPTPTQTPTVTPTPTTTPTPEPTATPSPTPRPRVTIRPAATPVDLDPPERLTGRTTAGLDRKRPWLLIVGALAAVGAAGAVAFLWYRRSLSAVRPTYHPPSPVAKQGPSPPVCSKGHTSPPGSRFCMTCGEPLE